MTFTDLSPLANHLWQSTLCAAVAWLLTLALRRNRAAVRYWLWLAASVKFLVPFSLLVSAGAQLGWRTAPAIARSQFSLAMDEIGQPFAAPAPTPLPAVVTPALTPLPAILFGVWLCGIAAGIVFWMRWWWRIRAVRRAATPLQLNPPVNAASSPARLEPGVVGIFKPVLLLPEGIADHLTPPQLEAIVEHELCHVRRRDNLTAAIHMVVETIFWFHPLAWWIRARLMEERERACDEEVMRMGREPRVYAESILRVCEFYLASPAPCAAGVTGGELKKRIESIMSNRFTRELNFGRRLLLAVVAVAAVAGPVVIGPMNAPRVRAQAQTATTALPKFEVASVKPATASSSTMGYPYSPGSYGLGKVPLAILIGNAYHVQRYQIDGPAWLDHDSFDVVAKLPDGAPREQIPQMLQSLLAERFKLVLHREARLLPIYALIVGKGGPKLKEVDPADVAGLRSGKIARVRGLKGPFTLTGVAVILSTLVDRPVQDLTGLKGNYDFDVTWTPSEHDSELVLGLEASRAEATGKPDEVPNASAPTGPTVFDAIEQLGLKLEPRKGPVEMLVIDHVERVPTGN